jgi:hypothetical protein
MLSRSLLPGVDGGFKTVVPEPGDSVHAYMHQLATAYGLPSVRPLLLEVGGTGPRPFSLACAPRLAELGGVSVKEISQLSGFDGEYEAGTSVWTFGAEKTSVYPGVNCRRLPLCVECLRTRSSAPGYVHLSAMLACPLHGIRLVAICPNCHTLLQSHRARLDRCGCRYSFKDLAGDRASEDEMVLSSAIYARISNAPLSGAKLQSQTGEFDLTVLPLDDLVYLHWALGHVLPNPRPCSLGTRRRLSPSECVDATKVCLGLLRYPDDIVPVVRSWLDTFKVHSDSGRTVPFGLFRSVLKRLMRMRGIPMIARLIAEEFDLLSRRHPFKPALGPQSSPQLALFEDAA